MSDDAKKGRDFNATVKSVLDAIPAEEASLRAEIERVRYAAAYQPPEAFHGWHEVSDVLTRALGRRREAWCDRVYEIWTGKDVPACACAGCLAGEAQTFDHCARASCAQAGTLTCECDCHGCNSAEGGPVSERRDRQVAANRAAARIVARGREE